jgi:hypothetical protein
LRLVPDRATLCSRHVRRTCARLCHLVGGGGTKSNSCAATHGSKRPSGTWAAGSGCEMRVNDNTGPERSVLSVLEELIWKNALS